MVSRKLLHNFRETRNFSFLERYAPLYTWSMKKHHLTKSERVSSIQPQISCTPSETTVNRPDGSRSCPVNFVFSFLECKCCIKAFECHIFS